MPLPPGLSPNVGAMRRSGETAPRHEDASGFLRKKVLGYSRWWVMESVVLGLALCALVVFAAVGAGWMFAATMVCAWLLMVAMMGLAGCDALVVMTDWQEFRSPDFDALKDKLKKRLIFDGRNLYDPKYVAKQGLEYHCVGRPSIPSEVKDPLISC